jgi:phage terminase small subunit
MSAYDDLTEKQRKFVEAYLAHGNATQAYQQAGYKGNANVAAV